MAQFRPRKRSIAKWWMGAVGAPGVVAFRDIARKIDARFFTPADHGELHEVDYPIDLQEKPVIARHDLSLDAGREASGNGFADDPPIIVR